MNLKQVDLVDVDWTRDLTSKPRVESCEDGI